jgi:hypothetical protein
MPCIGPVAYQKFHSGRFAPVSSRGAVQVTPLSSLYCTYGSRSHPLGHGAVPLCVLTRTIRPVRRSTIGTGFPRVSPLPSATTSSGPQVRPLSSERRSTRSMSSSSPQSLTRPSANASSVPAVVRTTAGMRKQAYPKVRCS